MYKEELLDLYSEKLNYGSLDKNEKTHEGESYNPACDDKIHIELSVKDGKIIDARFNGKACFISTVSACVLTEKIKGIDVKDALNLNKANLDKFLDMKIIETRIKCELLPLEALKEALRK